MASTNRSAARVGITGGGFGGVHCSAAWNTSEATPTRSLDQGFTEFLTEPEVRSVRRVWWNQRALGFRLPAERGVVVLPGGGR
jgi:hypothetical protein